MSYNLSIKELETKIKASKQHIKDLTYKITFLQLDIKKGLVKSRMPNKPKLKSELQEYHNKNSTVRVDIWKICEQIDKICEELRSEQKNLDDLQKKLSFKKFYA